MNLFHMDCEQIYIIILEIVAQIKKSNFICYLLTYFFCSEIQTLRDFFFFFAHFSEFSKLIKANYFLLFDFFLNFVF